MSKFYIITLSEDNWQDCYRYVNFLINEGITILWTTEPFKGITLSEDEISFARGTFLLKDIPSSMTNWIQIAQQHFDIIPTPIKSVKEFASLTLKSIRIAVYGGGGAPFNHARIFSELGFSVDFISPPEIKVGKLSEFDLFVMPGGGEYSMKGQLAPLGEYGCQQIKKFVQAGGMYLGSCAGALCAAINSDIFLEACPQQRHLQLINSLIWNRHDKNGRGLESPGIGVIENCNIRPEHPIMFGIPEKFQMTHYNGPFFELQSDILSDASNVIGVSSVAGFTHDFTPSEYFLSFNEYTSSKDAQKTLIDKAASEKRFNIICGDNGEGRVVLFGSHPEFGYNLTMDNMELPSKMLANAAFWQAGHIKQSRSIYHRSTQELPQQSLSSDSLQSLEIACDKVMRVIEEVRRLDTTHSIWLTDTYAMSTFGLSGREIWQQNLEAFDEVNKNIRLTLQHTKMLIDDAHSTINELESTYTVRYKTALYDVLLDLHEAVHYRVPEEWNQDFGYEGMLQMLQRTETMLQTAAKNANNTFESSPNSTTSVKVASRNAEGFELEFGIEKQSLEAVVAVATKTMSSGIPSTSWERVR